LRDVLTGYVDALLSQRLVVGIVLGDRTAAKCDSVSSVRAAMAAFRHSLAEATGGHLDDRIRAAAALGAVHAGVVEVDDVDPATVRAVVPDAAVAILLSRRPGG